LVKPLKNKRGYPEVITSKIIITTKFKNNYGATKK